MNHNKTIPYTKKYDLKDKELIKVLTLKDDVYGFHCLNYTNKNIKVSIGKVKNDCSNIMYLINSNSQVVYPFNQMFIPPIFCAHYIQKDFKIWIYLPSGEGTFSISLWHQKSEE